MVLELRAVGKRLGGQTVLADCCLQLPPGRCAIVTGENGAGKSTLLRLVAGVLEPSAGQILICGHDVHQQPRLAKAHLGYVPDGLHTLPDLLVSEFLALVRALHSPQPSDPTLGRGRDWEAAFGVPTVFGQRLPSLSLGQRKRVVLAAALLNEPALLLLDEPTNGLDSTGAQRVVDLVAQRSASGQSTLCTTNDPHFLQAVDNTAYSLRDGRLSRLAFSGAELSTGR